LPTVSEEGEPQIVPRRPSSKRVKEATEEEKESFREFYRLAGRRHRAKVRAEMDELQIRLDRLDDDNAALRKVAGEYRLRLQELVRTAAQSRAAASIMSERPSCTMIDLPHMCA